MKNITIRDILRVTDGKAVFMAAPEASGDEDDIRESRLSAEVKDISIDSRKIEPGDLFVPLLGENVDPNKYIPNVFPYAAASLTDWETDRIYPDPEMKAAAKERGDLLIRVENTQTALEQVGAYIRTQYEPTVVGVTGSVGKTTTRRMIATALGSDRVVYETPGNLNSKIGIPITTSRMLDEPSEVAVLEMGIDRIGEMDIEYSIVRPEIAVVTMIGVSHIEYLGSREGIRTEKLKIAGPDTVLFLNKDDPMLAQVRTGAKEIWYYGISPEADYHAEDLSLGNDGYAFTFVHGDTRVPMVLPVLGRHNVRNAVVALAICDYLGLDLEMAAEALGKFNGLRQLVNRRSDGAVIINDAYNASPDSMKAALEVLTDFQTEGRRIAVLGDMFELGPDEKRFHQEVGEQFASYHVDRLVTVGPLAYALAEEAKKVCPDMEWLSFPDIGAAAEYLKDNVGSGDTAIFKASHGMHFEQLAEDVLDNF